MSEAKRTRTYSWSDPMELVAAARGMSGLEFMRSFMDGKLPRPPFSETIDILMIEAEEGRVVFAVEPAEFQYNPIGMVHAGIALTMIDSAIGCAVHTLLPPGTGYSTLETKANFTRPLGRDTGRVLCEGKVVHFGSRTATGEARLTDGAGKLYAHGTSTCLILRP